MGKTHILSVPKPKCLESPLDVIPLTLTGPGPTNMSARVQKSQEHPLLDLTASHFSKVLSEIKCGLQYIFQTTTPYVFCIPGVGQAALEAAILNLLEPGDTLLVANNCIWADRAVEIGTRQVGLNVKSINKPIGEVFGRNEIEDALIKYKPTALFLTHVDSTAAVLQDVEDIGHLCHKYGTFLIVDSVASIAATPLLMDQWGIDIVYTATQKALSCPPGLAPIALSENAMKKIKERKTKPSTYYFDIMLIANWWSCFEDENRIYHHTFLISISYALRESLAEIASYGLEWHWKRQLRVKEFFYQGLEKLGYKLYVKNKAIRAPTITSVVVPKGIEWGKVKKHLYDEYQITILGGLGLTMGKVFRIGLMGPNCNEKQAQRVIDAFHTTIENFKDVNNLCNDFI